MTATETRDGRKRTMSQNRQVVSSVQEYPGSVVWKDYEYECPECHKMAPPSDVTTEIDGEHHYCCQACADEILKGW